MMRKFYNILRQALRGEEYDYTTGNINKAIVLLAIPMILELSLESVFAVVDMYFVSHLPNSKNAIAAVGLTESVISLVYTIAIGLSTAVTAVVARRVGEKNVNAAAHAAAQSLVLALIAALITSIAGIFFAEKILILMGAEESVAKEGAVYTQIMLGGSTVIIMLFLINGIFRGAGNAAMAMKSLWIASIINIILCPVLIYGVGFIPPLGLKGAAIATTIGRGIGVLYQCYHLFKAGDGVIKIRKPHLTWDWPVIKTLYEVAWPATLQFFIQSGSWIFITYLVASSGGTDASAGYQVAIRNVVFFILPAWGLSNAAATLVGQNLGAGQVDRAEKSVLLTARYNAYFMAAVMILFVFFSSAIISIFTKEPVVHQYGTSALRIIGSGYIFYGIGMVMIQALNGAGDTRTPTWINIFGFWLFQIPLAYILAKVMEWGAVGAFTAIPIAEFFIALIAYYFFKKGKWKEVKL